MALAQRLKAQLPVSSVTAEEGDGEVVVHNIRFVDLQAWLYFQKPCPYRGFVFLTLNSLCITISTAYILHLPELRRGSQSAAWSEGEDLGPHGFTL